MGKFELFNGGLIQGTQVLVWFKSSSFWNTLGEGPRFSKPDALLVTWPIKSGANSQALALHSSPVNRVLTYSSEQLIPMRRVMGNWTPWVGEHVEILRGQPDLRTGKYSSVSFHTVNLVVPADTGIDEVYVCLDRSE